MTVIDGHPAGETRQPGQVTLSAARRAWVVGVMCLGVMLVISAMSSLYGALPDLGRETKASQTELTWIIDAYTLVFACLLLPAGAIGDRYGRRAILIAGLVVFTASAALGLLNDSPSWLILCRALTGMGAAMIMPSTLSLITAIYPADQRGKAVGLWSATTVLGGAIGLVYGGALLEFYSWRSIFAVTAIGSALVLALVWTVPASRDRTQPRLDVPGTFLSSAAVGCFVFGIIEAPERGWTSPLVIGTLAASVLLTVAFCGVETRTEHPLLDVRLLRVPAFGVATLTLCMQFATGFGYFLIIMQYLQFIRGYSSFIAAVAITPMAISLIPLSLAAPALTVRFGMRIVASFGLGVSAIAYLLCMGLDEDRFYLYALTVALLGVGYGLTMACGSAAIVDNLPDSKQGVASALNNASREVGAAIGVAVAGNLLASGYTDSFKESGVLLPEPVRHIAEESAAGAIAIADASGPAGAPLEAAAQAAFIEGMQDAFLGLGILMVVTALVAVWLAPGRASARQGVDAAIGARAPRFSHAGGVHGTVRTRGGTPVPGVRVALMAAAGTMEASSDTDESGRYALDSSGSGEYLLLCIAESFPPQISGMTLNGERLEHNVVMTGSSSIFGQVLLDGLPVESAPLTLIDYDGTVIDHVSSTADGAYRFEKLIGGRYALAVATHPDPVVSMVEVPATGCLEHDVLLRRGHRLTGTVRWAETLKPIAGSTVTVAGSDVQKTESTKTAPDGTFEIDQLPAGSFTVTTSVQREISTPVDVSIDQELDLDL